MLIRETGQNIKRKIPLSAYETLEICLDLTAVLVPSYSNCLYLLKKQWRIIVKLRNMVLNIGPGI